MTRCTLRQWHCGSSDNNSQTIGTALAELTTTATTTSCTTSLAILHGHSLRYGSPVASHNRYSWESVVSQRCYQAPARDERQREKFTNFWNCPHCGKPFLARIGPPLRTIYNPCIYGQRYFRDAQADQILCGRNRSLFLSKAAVCLWLSVG